jgi:hypothetical protein
LKSPGRSDEERRAKRELETRAQLARIPSYDNDEVPKQSYDLAQAEFQTRFDWSPMAWNPRRPLSC